MGISTTVSAKYGYLYESIGFLDEYLEYASDEVYFDGDESLRTLKSLLQTYQCDLDYTDPLTGNGYWVLYYTGHSGTKAVTPESGCDGCKIPEFIAPEWEVNTDIPDPVRLLDISKTTGSYGLEQIKGFIEKETKAKPVSNLGWLFIVSQW